MGGMLPSGRLEKIKLIKGSCAGTPVVIRVKKARGKAMSRVPVVSEEGTLYRRGGRNSGIPQVMVSRDGVGEAPVRRSL